MGSGASAKYRLGGGYSKIKGSKICDDVYLQELLEEWGKLGVSFSGAMLQAEGKDTVTEYDKERDRWTGTDTILGQTKLVLKTTGDGLLVLRLAADVGFQWQHQGSYRLAKKGKAEDSIKLTIVDSFTEHFEVATLKKRLEEIRLWKYGTASDCDLRFEDFAIKLFESLADRRCEGTRALDPLKGKLPDRSASASYSSSLSNVQPAAPF
eukprot:TRINITY_DN66799_c0_g1_i1.p1 TRINITY_DN66799_c0_g1~~TRINITY_DN66799_c0_g1_i1.p1  ORF type:complete len:209 (+),score=49.25 TRINITY_DN66799_c0_g1_i1:49-675(+)